MTVRLEHPHFVRSGLLGPVSGVVYHVVYGNCVSAGVCGAEHRTGEPARIYLRERVPWGEEVTCEVVNLLVRSVYRQFGRKLWMEIQEENRSLARLFGKRLHWRRVKTLPGNIKVYEWESPPDWTDARPGLLRRIKRALWGGT